MADQCADVVEDVARGIRVVAPSRTVLLDESCLREVLAATALARPAVLTRFLVTVVVAAAARVSVRISLRLLVALVCRSAILLGPPGVPVAVEI